MELSFFFFSFFSPLIIFFFFFFFLLGLCSLMTWSELMQKCRCQQVQYEQQELRMVDSIHFTVINSPHTEAYDACSIRLYRFLWNMSKSIRF